MAHAGAFSRPPGAKADVVAGVGSGSARETGGAGASTLPRRLASALSLTAFPLPSPAPYRRAAVAPFDVAKPVSGLFTQCSALSGSESAYPLPKRAKDPEAEQSARRETAELDQEELDSFLALDFQSAYDIPPRHYEFVWLVGEASLAEVPQLLEKVKETVAEMRGKIWRLNDWGLRPLAYKIKKQRRANYFLLNVEVSPEKANELNAFFQKNELVIRHLMTKVDKAETKNYPAPLLFNDPREEGSEAEFDDDEDEDELSEEEDDEEEEGDEEEDDDEEEGDEEESIDENENDRASLQRQQTSTSIRQPL